MTSAFPTLFAAALPDTFGLELPGGLRLVDPIWLLALGLLPVALWVRSRGKVPVLVVPFASAWVKSSAMNWSRGPVGLGMLGFALVVIALSRPQRVEDKREVHSKGYDIILAIDLSTSMLAEDYERDGGRINRMQAVKPVFQSFIAKRPDDRIGIVVFSGRSYTLAPLTFDHAWLLKQTERLKPGMIEDGTAIGDGLGVALTRLEQQEREEAGRRKGAFIVLLTDGANNRGAMTPEQATQIAKSRGIPVYTIGAGKDGRVRMPVFDTAGRVMDYQWMMSDLDERPLIRIADETGGHFYRADDVSTTERAFAAISKAQKIEFQAQSYYLTTELFPWFAAPGALALLVVPFWLHGLSLFQNRRKEAVAK